MRRCPVCHRALGSLSNMVCGACAVVEARKEEQREAGIMLWASQGIRELGELLARHAAFEEWLKHR